MTYVVTPTGSNLAFLLGLPRSGTTLLSAMLARHPAIEVPPEPWVLLALQAMGKTSADHPANSQLLGEAVREFAGGPRGIEAARAYATTIYNQKLAEANKSFLVDKTPRYFLILPYIQALFPDARWIVLQRNPLDVAASYKSSWGADIPALLRDFSDNLAYIDLVIGLRRLADFAQAHPQASVVHYEQLVAEPEATIGRVVSQLGLAPADGLTEFDVNAGALGKSFAGDKKIKDTHAPHARSIDTWQSAFSNDDLQILHDAIGSATFERLGYGTTLAKLRERGVVDRGPDVTSEWFARIETRLAERVARVSAASSMTTDSGAEKEAASASIGEIDYVDTAAVARARQSLAEQKDYHAGEIERLRAGWEAESKLAGQLRDELAHRNAEANRLQEGWQNEAKIAEQFRIDWQKEAKIAEQLRIDWQNEAKVAEQLRNDWQSEARVTEQLRTDLHRVTEQLHGELQQTRDVQARLQAQTGDLQVQTTHLRTQIANLQAQLERAGTDARRLQAGWDAEARGAVRLREQLEEAVRETTNLAEALAARGSEMSLLLQEASRLRNSLQAKTIENQQHVEEARQVNERLTQQATDIANLKGAARWLEGDRNTWSGRALSYEAQLARIENYTWYERIYDTLMRIAKNVLIGQPHLRPGVGESPLPRISIVVPTRNAERSIEASLASIVSQGYPNLELIVVDGGSQDATLSIVERYRPSVTRVISEADEGMYDAIAKGYLQSTGEILGYLRAGDLFEAGALLRVGEYFHRHRRAKVVLQEHTRLAGPMRFPAAAATRRACVDQVELLKGADVSLDAVMYRRSAYFGVGGFDRTLRHAGDWDLCNRLARPFRIRCLSGHMKAVRERSINDSDRLAMTAEIEAARAKFLSKFGALAKTRAWTLHAINRLRRAWPEKQPLAFKMGQPNKTGSPDDASDASSALAETNGNFLCPLTGRAPDRLLFCSPVAGNGSAGAVRRVYYHGQSHLAQAEITHPVSEGASASGNGHHPPASDLRESLAALRGSQASESSWMRRWPAPGLSRRRIQWDDPTVQTIVRVVSAGVDAQDTTARFLQIGAGSGKLLDAVRKATSWQTFGLEIDESSANAARARGHTIWDSAIEDAPFVVPDGMLFDVIFVGEDVESPHNWSILLRRLRDLLMPQGYLVLCRPNLDSKQVELFGPAWAPWHQGTRRLFLSPHAMREMASEAELRVAKLSTMSHPMWTAQSLALVSPQSSSDAREAALNLTAWSRLLYDWRGRGDYFFVALQRLQ